MRWYTLLLYSTVFFLSVHFVYPYPRIQKLTPNDPLFIQQQTSIASYYQNRLRNTEDAPLQLYEYAITPQDTLLRISARLLLPYATIASFNDVSQVQEPIEERIFIVPNKPGVFIPQGNRTVLHQLIARRLSNTQAEGIQIMITLGETSKNGTFYEGVDLTAYERSQFLRALFQFPLTNMRLTSPFGSRTHPIEGYTHHHNGIDLGAPEGTPVYSAQAGVVIAIETDAKLGLLLVIEHDFGYVTRYGHLSSTFVEVGNLVDTNTIIALVGNTGVSTGPHLHFEIEKEGRFVNPLLLLPKYGITQ